MTNTDEDWERRRRRAEAAARAVLFQELQPDAPDVAQEALAKALEDPARLRSVKNLDAWICKIARNFAHERNRQLGRKLREPRTRDSRVSDFWKSIDELLEHDPPPTHPYDTFVYRRGSLYGQRALVLVMEVEGPRDQIRAFCLAVNAAYHFARKTRPERRELNFSVLLAWLAACFSKHMEFLEAPTLMLSNDLRALEPWDRVGGLSKTVPDLAQRFSYPGGAQAVRDLIRRCRRFQPSTAQFRSPITRFPQELVPAKP